MLDTFESQPLTDEEGSALNLEDEASNFSIKYLTSSNLMGLEVGVLQDFKILCVKQPALNTIFILSLILDLSQLKDPSFRRHILVQCLILFDYIKVLLSLFS